MKHLDHGQRIVDSCREGVLGRKAVIQGERLQAAPGDQVRRQTHGGRR